MSISEMTGVSYFFTIMAAVFGIITVIMYFAMDIKRCWGILRGRHVVVSGDNTSFDISSNAGQRRSSNVSEKTKKLVPEKTETLSMVEETTLLETITLVQDIVIMDVERGR